MSIYDALKKEDLNLWIRRRLAEQSVSPGINTGNSALGRFGHGLRQGGSAIFRWVNPDLQEDPVVEAQKQVERVAENYGVDPNALAEASGNKSSLGLNLAQMGGQLLGELPTFLGGARILGKATTLPGEMAHGAALFGGMEAAKAPEGKRLKAGLHGATLGGAFGAISKGVAPLHSNIAQRVAAGVGFGGVTAADELIRTGHVDPANVGIQAVLGGLLHTSQSPRAKTKALPGSSAQSSIPGTSNYNPSRSIPGTVSRGLPDITVRDTTRLLPGITSRALLTGDRTFSTGGDVTRGFLTGDRTFFTGGDVPRALLKGDVPPRGLLGNTQNPRLQRRIDKLNTLRFDIATQINNATDPAAVTDLQNKLRFIDDQLAKFNVPKIFGDPGDPKLDPPIGGPGAVWSSEQRLLSIREDLIDRLNSTMDSTEQARLRSQLDSVDNILWTRTLPEGTTAKPVETGRMPDSAALEAPRGALSPEMGVRPVETPGSSEPAIAMQSNTTKPFIFEAFIRPPDGPPFTVKINSNSLEEAMDYAFKNYPESRLEEIVDITHQNKDIIDVTPEKPTHTIESIDADAPPEVKLVTRHLLRDKTGRFRARTAEDLPIKLNPSAQKVADSFSQRITKAQARKAAARAKGELHIESDAKPTASELIDALDCD